MILWLLIEPTTAYDNYYYYISWHASNVFVLYKGNKESFFSLLFELKVVLEVLYFYCYYSFGCIVFFMKFDKTPCRSFDNTLKLEEDSNNCLYASLLVGGLNL